MNNLVGMIFGRLTVVKFSHKKNSKNFWLCNCSCGNKKTVYQGHLNTGATKSCGCIRKERFHQIITKHGMTNSRIYKTWRGMRERCNYTKHKNFKDYGGRGIAVCDEWNDSISGFKTFLEWAMENEYKEGLTIGRINNNGNYEPNNCRWETMKEQSQNRRNTVRINIRGREYTLKDAARELGLSAGYIKNKYYSNPNIKDWSNLIALTEADKKGK